MLSHRGACRGCIGSHAPFCLPISSRLCPEAGNSTLMSQPICFPVFRDPFRELFIHIAVLLDPSMPPSPFLSHC